jgi:hypothetical protein
MSTFGLAAIGYSARFAIAGDGRDGARGGRLRTTTRVGRRSDQPTYLDEAVAVPVIDYVALAEFLRE